MGHRILVTSRGDIFPPTHGAAVKLYETLTGISKRNEVFFLTEHPDFYYHVNGNFRKLPFPRRMRTNFIGVSKQLLRILGIPDEDWILFHPLVNLPFLLRLRYLVRKERCDLIHAEFPAFGLAAGVIGRLEGIPSITVEHNIEWQRLQDSAPHHQKAHRRVKKIERMLKNVNQKIITVSAQDKRKLQTIGIPEKKIRVIPHGVSLDRANKAKSITELRNLAHPILIFHGVLNYPPNYDAVSFLVKVLAPATAGTILIVGDHADVCIQKITPNVPENVVFTGVVHNLEDVIKSADCAIVPLAGGGGTRMKILEYFACGIPVISTEKGAEGIDCPKNAIFLVSSLDEIKTTIPKALSPEGEKRSRTAKKWISRFDWETITKQYDSVYDELKPV